MRDLSPLHPVASAPLRFSVDRLTHEELRSAGLEINIVRQHTISGYKYLRNKATRSAKGAANPLPFNTWIKLQSQGNKEDLFRQYPFYIIELNLNNRATFENHIRHTKKYHSNWTIGNNGETLGFLSFNEQVDDKDWLDVRALYIDPKYQKLGIGTFLLKAVAGLGLSNNKKGIEVDDPFFYWSSDFFSHRGMDLLYRTSRHRYGCAQLKLINDNDGSKNTFHQLLPAPWEYPLEFKQLKGPDPMGLL